MKYFISRMVDFDPDTLENPNACEFNQILAPNIHEASLMRLDEYTSRSWSKWQIEDGIWNKIVIHPNFVRILTILDISKPGITANCGLKKYMPKQSIIEKKVKTYLKQRNISKKDLSIYYPNLFSQNTK